MNKLPPQTWQYNGQTFTVSLFVEGGEVVFMTPVTTSGGIVVPPKKYIGTQMGEAIGKATGRKPCQGCRKAESVLDWGHKKLVSLG